MAQEVLGIRTNLNGKVHVVLYASVEDAIGFGNSYMLFSNAEEIASDIRRISSDLIFEAYNSIVPSVRRWKSTDEFSTRIEGAIAIWEMALKRLPVLKRQMP